MCIDIIVFSSLMEYPRRDLNPHCSGLEDQCHIHLGDSGVIERLQGGSRTRSNSSTDCYATDTPPATYGGRKGSRTLGLTNISRVP